ncbi:MAG TPA: PEGA domain-containing protein [Vicinamibacterales bacterium]|nr:PEGA domain-containing protein [Vicinamibacterales bacterium]
MDLKFLSVPAMMLAATTLAATPAFAQRRGGTPHESRQSESHGQAEHRSSPERAQPRAEAPRQAPAPRVQQAPRVEQRVQPQREVIAPRAAVRGGVAVPNGAVRNGVAVPRVAPRYDNRYYGGHADNRYYGGHYDNRYYYGGRYYTSPWRGYYGYSPFRPYYFRPHFSLGFGIYLGYPVPYYSYPYPVPVYGYGAPYGEVTVGPNNSAYGGVALEITPNDAAVYVDGNYAGIVSDFDGSRQPLTLVPGAHHIEVVQNGFEPWAFDVTVQPGMVIPYQGALRPY